MTQIVFDIAAQRRVDNWVEMKGFSLVCSVHDQVQAVLAVAAVGPAVSSAGSSGMGGIVAVDAMHEVVVWVVVLMQQGPCGRKG